MELKVEFTGIGVTLTTVECPSYFGACGINQLFPTQTDGSVAQHTSTELDGCFEEEDGLLPVRWSSMRSSGKALFTARFELYFWLFGVAMLSGCWLRLRLYAFGKGFAGLLRGLLGCHLTRRQGGSRSLLEGFPPFGAGLELDYISRFPLPLFIRVHFAWYMLWILIPSGVEKGVEPTDLYSRLAWVYR